MKQSVCDRFYKWAMFFAALIVVTIALAPYTAFAATNSISASHSLGSVIVGYNSNTCNAALGGAIRYNSLTGGTDFCNGTNWLSTFLQQDSILSNCVAGNKGVLRYSSSGGNSSGYITASSADFADQDINLTAMGAQDWANWSGSVSPYSRKSGGGTLISNITSAGSVSGYNNHSSTFSYTDGTPNAVVSHRYGTYFTPSASSNFSFTVPAGLGQRTMRMYYGAWSSGLTITFTLSDGSYPVQTLVTTTTAASQAVYKVATVQYNAASAGQTMTIAVNMTTNVGGIGYPSLSAVWLSPESTWVAAQSYMQVCNGSNFVPVGPGSIPAGLDQYVQYNSTGNLGGSAGFTFNDTTDALNITGAYQIGGFNALQQSASGNPILGRTAMSPVLAPLSVGIGRDALAAVTTEVESVAIGYQALALNQTGTRNTAAGYQALYNNLSGSDNTAAGYRALYSNTTGNENTAAGADALSGCGNGVAGTGSFNTAIGSSALCSNTTGYNNTAHGRRALYLNTTGYDNTAVGSGALASNVIGNSNTALGYNALTLSTGNNNVGLGYLAGSTLTAGSNNIAIGASVQLPNTTGSNQLNIGNTIYGDRSTGAVAIGTSTFTPMFMVKPPGSQSFIAGASTIAATACGTIKKIAANAGLSTDATNTFTAPSAANNGCCMDVINIGANAYTLVRNARFKTSTGADLVLGPSYAVRVCSNGTAWYQTMVMSPNG